MLTMNLRKLVKKFWNQVYCSFSRFYNDFYPIKELRKLKNRNSELEEINAGLLEQLVRNEAELKQAYFGLEQAVEVETKLKKQIELQQGLISHLKRNEKEYKKAISEILRSYPRFLGELITSLTKKPVAILDDSGKIVAATESMKKMFGVEHIEGLDYREIIRVEKDYEERFRKFNEDSSLNEIEVIAKVRGENRRREGLIISKRTSPRVNLESIHFRYKEKISVPICTYICAKKSRVVVRKEIERLVNYIEGIIKKH